MKAYQEELATLRDKLIDLAYHSADAAWQPDQGLINPQFLSQTGMPIAKLDVRHSSSVVAEAYGRGVFYKLADAPELQQLSTASAGQLAGDLLDALFEAADSANRFIAGAPMHQYYLGHQSTLGVPLTPAHRLEQAVRGENYICQHFSLDTLCSPIERPRTIIRLSELLALDGLNQDNNRLEPEERALRDLLLDDLYIRLTGHQFAADALFCAVGVSLGLGAPLGAPQLLTVGEYNVMALRFATDIVYCRTTEQELATTTDYHAYLPLARSFIGGLSGLTLWQGLELPAETARPIEALPLTDLPPYSGPFLGPAAMTTIQTDLTWARWLLMRRTHIQPQRILVYLTGRTARQDLSQPIWHIYLTQTGATTRLLPLHYPVGATPYVGQGLGAAIAQEWVLVVALEGRGATLTGAQRQQLPDMLQALQQQIGSQLPISVVEAS